jgi:hypothetical protein
MSYECDIADHLYKCRNFPDVKAEVKYRFIPEGASLFNDLAFAYPQIMEFPNHEAWAFSIRFTQTFLSQGVIDDLTRSLGEIRDEVHPAMKAEFFRNTGVAENVVRDMIDRMIAVVFLPEGGFTVEEYDEWVLIHNTLIEAGTSTETPTAKKAVDLYEFGGKIAQYLNKYEGRVYAQSAKLAREFLTHWALLVWYASALRREGRP